MRMDLSTHRRPWASALLSACCLFGSAAAIAESVTLTAIASLSARDSNLDGDMSMETLLPEGTLFVSDSPQYNERTIFDFRLPSVLLQPQMIIEKATLVIPVLDVSPTNGGTGLMHISGYGADETLTLDDFNVPLNMQSTRFPNVDPDGQQRFDMTWFLSYFAEAFPGYDRISLMAAVDTFFWVQWDPNARLEIEYSFGPLPNLSVISPTQPAQYWTSDDIHLQASASDWQDGDLDAAIQWTLIQGDHSEPLGTGPELTVNLPDGIYRIEVSVTDSDGHTVTAIRDIDVATLGNARPEVAIAPPTDGGTVVEGTPVALSASANDLEDGSIDHLVVWTNEQGDVLGEGATVSSLLPVGTHTIFAAVTDSGGLRAVTSVTVQVLPGPTYCTVGTQTTGPGWIATTRVNGTSHVSPSNGGYANFTATQFSVARGGNTLMLSAGGPTFVNKYWGVWIDLNQDTVFTANELLVSVNRISAASITRTLTIPATARPGATRMRVGVTFLGPSQPCGVVDAGEFEDYTVLIPAP